MKSRPLVGFLALLGLSSCSDSRDSELLARSVLNFESLNTKLLIEARCWGLAGNDELITIKVDSTYVGRDSLTDYAFVCTEIYFRQSRDSLIIYAPTSSMYPKPINWTSPVVVHRIELKGYDEVMLYRTEYARYGLSKVSVYPP